MSKDPFEEIRKKINEEFDKLHKKLEEIRKNALEMLEKLKKKS